MTTAKKLIQSIVPHIIEKYGYKEMRDVWIEELLELAINLQKEKRCKINSEEIREEMADVIFCIEQMKFFHDKEKLNSEVVRKVLRTKERLL